MIRKESRAKVLEIQVGSLLAFSILSIWVLGDRVSLSESQRHSDALRQPFGNGALATAAILALLAVQLLYSSAIAALDTLRSHHIRQMREDNEAAADQLQPLLDHRVRFATASQVGRSLVRLGTMLLVVIVGHGLAIAFTPESAGFGILEMLKWIAIVGAPVLILNVVIGELVPASYASHHPVQVLLRLRKLIRVSAVVLSGPAVALVALANLLTNRFGAKAAFRSVNEIEEEIKTLAESAEATGAIESEERILIHSVFEFNDTVAREVMTPRVELDAMPINSDPRDVVRVIQQTGHSRIPLFEGTDDQIIGIVHAKDLLLALVERPDGLNLRSLVRAPLFVPEEKNIHDLLREMRVTRSQLAVVQDEFGGTAGIVTIEDIVEELVGDIVDEYDTEEQALVTEASGWLVNGKTHLDDLNDQIGTDFESEEFDTLGGFLFGSFGRQPDEGESIVVEGHLFTIVETDGRRILQVRIEPVPEVSINSDEE